MNRGELPGFYWDEEKKRYFKIQANHLVPDGAKYGKETVNQDRRLTKKRKVDERKRLKRETQSIQPPPALKSAPLGKTGLLREQQGFSRLHHASQQREEAMVLQWTPQRFEIKLGSRESRLSDAHYIPEAQQMLVASSAPNGSTSIYAREWEWDAELCSGDSSNNGTPVAAAAGSLTSISSRSSDNGCLVVGSTESNTEASIFACFLPTRDPDGMGDGEHQQYMTRGTYNILRGCSDTAIHPELESAALIGAAGIYLLDTERGYGSLELPPMHDEWPGCDTGISWLNYNTVLYGAKETEHSVMLWDIRSRSGKVARFTMQNRLTGVFTPSQEGTNINTNPHEILASTNRDINLFDVRMPRSETLQREAPILRFNHVHGGPRLQSAARGSLVAAVDRDNVVQVYSIRTGAKVTSLATPPWQWKRFESPVLRKLMWYDDPEAGSVLQAVRGNGVMRWSWRGGEGEEGEEDEA